MPVLVEPDPTEVEALLEGDAPGLATRSRRRPRCMAWLDQHRRVRRRPRPHARRSRRPRSCRARLRIARPTISVVLVRDEVDTEVLDPRHAGRRPRRRGRRRPPRCRAAVERAYQLYLALRGPGGATQHGPRRHRLLPQGRGRQDHDRGQPRAGARPTRAPARSAWSTSTWPSATSRSPCSCSRPTRSSRRSAPRTRLDLRWSRLLTRHAGLADGAGRARRTPTRATGSRRRWSSGCCAPSEGVRLRRGRHRARASTSRR